MEAADGDGREWEKSGVWKN